LIKRHKVNEALGNTKQHKLVKNSCFRSARYHYDRFITKLRISYFFSSNSSFSSTVLLVKVVKLNRTLGSCHCVIFYLTKLVSNLRCSSGD